MIKAKLFALLSVLFVIALATLPVQAQPSQESLVKAWEQVQRSDPETLVFEKIADGRYKFKTARFPFDGELRVLKVSVDNAMNGGDDEFAFTSGVVEYDLPGLSAEVEKKYEHSFEKWQQTNTLNYDRETRSWLTREQFFTKNAAKSVEKSRSFQLQEENKKNNNAWVNLVLSWLPMLMLFGFWGWMWKRGGLKGQRERLNLSVVHMQRVEELLERIASSVEGGRKNHE